MAFPEYLHIFQVGVGNHLHYQLIFFVLFRINLLNAGFVTDEISDQSQLTIIRNRKRKAPFIVRRYTRFEFLHHHRGGNQRIAIGIDDFTFDG
ncbi:hypothetical protein SDC9_97782 [bioreactor metagenome]|uniref:Uncharacterized protein n=1 Tax=bioreactor metagenome TaxID=1076179 RepID=A0A645ADJ2_9ZZZZ